MTVLTLNLWIVIITLLLSLILVNANNNCGDSTCDYCLEQSDFDDGTYIITQSGKYCLYEDIIFNPITIDINTPNKNTPYGYTQRQDLDNIDSSNWKSLNPFCDNETYSGCDDLLNGDFGIGYFAAILIQIDNVEIDLKNYKISQDESFYFLQRLFTIFKIGNGGYSSLLKKSSTTNSSYTTISDIYIHDGIVGLSSYCGIQVNNAENIQFQRLRIQDFEVTGIIGYDCNTINVNSLIIGPSSTQIKPSGYYTDGQLISYALLDLLIDNSTISDFDTIIEFENGREQTIGEIYENLMLSLDIGFRSFTGNLTQNDLDNVLYEESIKLYSNPLELPSNAGLYGLDLNNIQKVEIRNVKIQDLTLNTLEIPGIDFGVCSNDDNNNNNNNIEGESVVTGPFGKIFDIRTMVGGVDNAVIIDIGDIISGGPGDIIQINSGLLYEGNPVSDALILLGLYREEYGQQQGLNNALFSWVLSDYDGLSYDGLPSCVSFICNGDIDGNTNEGIIGVNGNNIKNMTIENVIIKRLINKSPLSSYVCGNYSSNTKGSDTKGIVINGGCVSFDGYNNVIEQLVSFNGATIGLHGINGAEIIFDYVYKDVLPAFLGDSDSDTDNDRSSIQIQQLCPGHEITFSLLAELISEDKYPNPNVFYACNILLDETINNKALIIPNPPNGIEQIWCADYIPYDLDEIIANVMPVEIEYETNDNQDTTTSPSNNNASTNQLPAIIINNNNNNNNNNINTKNYGKPYLFFAIGLMTIISVVFVLMWCLMKCGKHKQYRQAKYIDSDTDSDYIDDHQHELNQPI